MAIDPLPQVACSFLGRLDIAILRRPVASNEQHDEDIALLDEVDTVSRPVVDAQL